MDLTEGEYIEHWENGIGKVLKVGESSITINFIRHGKTEVLKEGTKFLKKLNPQGFWAHFFNNPDLVHELVKEDPIKIVKLLILDLDPIRGKKIERSQLKTLLTGAGPNVSGWRRDFALVENWESWWKSTAKRLKEDPWIEMSKSTIALREEAISKIQTLHEQFLKEKKLKERILISEQLLKVCDKAQHEVILNDIRDFFINLFQSSIIIEFLDLTVYNIITLQDKGFQIPGFDDNSYLLSLRVLLSGKLPTEKLLHLYFFFSKLPKQNPNDHLILFVFANKKIKEKIINFFKKKGRLTKGMSIVSNEEVLTSTQLHFFSRFQPEMEEIFSQSIIEILAHIPEPYPSSFFHALLLSTEINESIKRVVAISIARQGMETIVYKYLLKVCSGPSEEEIPFLHDFLKAIGPIKTEWTLRNILLTRATANQNPTIYLAAIKLLVSDSRPVINIEQKEPLLYEVKKLLSTDTKGTYKDLLLQISNIAGTTNDFEKLSETISDKDVVNIAKTRQVGIRQRREALKLLASRGLKNECLDLAQDLIGTIQPEEFVLLQDILKYFPDMPSAKNLIRLSLEKPDMGKVELCSAFVNFVMSSGHSKAFSEVILLDHQEPWQGENSQKVKNLLLQDESLVREVVRFGVERMLSQEGLSSYIKDNLILFLPPFMDKVLEEMKIVVSEKIRSLKSNQEDLIDRHEREKRRQAGEFETILHDATIRTSQRFEQYLKHLIPILGQIEIIQQDLDSLEISKTDIKDKLAIMREDIQWVLKTLKVIDREQS
jgi:hypothetical protein